MIASASHQSTDNSELHDLPLNCTFTRNQITRYVFFLGILSSLEERKNEKQEEEEAE